MNPLLRNTAMKKLLVFTILFLSSFKVTACGYSPYGEDVRYCLFNPKYFNYNQYYGFYYNNFAWGYDVGQDDLQAKIPFESNIIDWYNFTGKKVNIDEIIYFNNELKLTDIHSGSENEFLKFLYKNKKKNVIQYLIYAKKCEGFNVSNYENSWERVEEDQKISAGKFEKELFEAYTKEKDKFLKRKYAFQCIRLAFYNGNQRIIQSVFAEEFANSRKDYLYYWSLYFHCFTAEVTGNYNDVADIFANSPEKAFASQFYFSSKFNLEKALPFAKNPNQVANLYAYSSARIVSKNLENLKVIYRNKPKFKTLDFLLLREINKLEDWIYTPFYTNYSPSIEEGSYYSESENSKITTQTLRARANKDCLYAKEVLDFVSTVDFNKVDNPVLWKAAEIQLLFMVNRYDQALKKISDFEGQYKKEKISVEIEKIKALCITAKQAYGKAIITDEVQAIIEKNKTDSRFLFALGRELEFRGNLLDGIALISLNSTFYHEVSSTADDVEWRGNRLNTSSNLDVFYNYYDYLDFVYPASNLQVILNQLNTMSSDKRENFVYSILFKDKNYLIDLLGTKYIREEKLNMALVAFKSLPEKYWQENYNAWERGEFDEYLSFDENPFYVIPYTDNFIKAKEKYFVNKLSITEHLIKYLKLANDDKRKDRDYYYFLVANCYLNMTDMGNSWMMRRFSSYSTYDDTYLNESYIDNLEYRTRSITKLYYEMAYKTSKSDKFRALCLHMVNFTQAYANSPNQLKIEYPQYNEELSSCLVFEDYFNSRR
jgi:hypothetical protein